MSRLTKLAIIAAFIKMFSDDSYMNVCTLEEMIKLSGVQKDENVMRACGLIHCISWSKLPEEVRTEAMIEVANMFGLKWEDVQSNKLCARV